MGARTYRTRHRSVDPALAERTARAIQRITGFRPKVTATRVEIPYADEKELAELAEALERASLIGIARYRERAARSRAISSVG